MKYCYRFSNKIREELAQADEIKIFYAPGQGQELIPFIEKYSDKVISLNVRDPRDFFIQQEEKVLRAIVEKYADVKIVVCFGINSVARELDAELKENILKLAPIPFYFDTVICDWETLHYYLELGVQQICIAEQLGFELPAVKKICDAYKVGIRAFPNVAQGRISTTDGLKKFFIRPEDIDIYAEYIDTFEFWGPDDRQATYRKIYEKREWYGDLSEIIFGLKISLDSRTIIPVWASTRTDCGRKCLQGKRCSICERISRISDLLIEKNLIIKTKKND